MLSERHSIRFSFERTHPPQFACQLFKCRHTSSKGVDPHICLGTRFMPDTLESELYSVYSEPNPATYTWPITNQPMPLQFAYQYLSYVLFYLIRLNFNQHKHIHMHSTVHES